MVRAKASPKVDDFEGPKKPAMGAYFMWCADNRARLTEVVKAESAAAGKSFSVTDLGMRLANAYKVECTEEQKKAYTIKSEILKKEHAEKMEEWKKTDKHAEYVKSKAEWTKKSKLKVAKNAVKEAGMPSKPLSAYFIFVNQERPKLMTELKAKHGAAFKIGMVAGEAGRLWKLLTDEQKVPLEAQAKEAKAKYDVELAKFKESDSFKAFEAANLKAHGEKKKRVPRGEKKAGDADGVKKERKPRAPRGKKAAAEAEEAKMDAATTAEASTEADVTV